MVHSESMAQPGSEYRNDPGEVYIVGHTKRLRLPQTGWAILNRLGHTQKAAPYSSMVQPAG